MVDDGGESSTANAAPATSAASANPLRIIESASSSPAIPPPAAGATVPTTTTTTTTTTTASPAPAEVPGQFSDASDDGTGDEAPPHADPPSSSANLTATVAVLTTAGSLSDGTTGPKDKDGGSDDGASGGFNPFAAAAASLKKAASPPASTIPAVAPSRFPLLQTTITTAAVSTANTATATSSSPMMTTPSVTTAKAVAAQQGGKGTGRIAPPKPLATVAAGSVIVGSTFQQASAKPLTAATTAAGYRGPTILSATGVPAVKSSSSSAGVVAPSKPERTAGSSRASSSKASRSSGGSGGGASASSTAAQQQQQQRLAQAPRQMADPAVMKCVHDLLGLLQTYGPLTHDQLEYNLPPLEADEKETDGAGAMGIDAIRSEGGASKLQQILDLLVVLGVVHVVDEAEVEREEEERKAAAVKSIKGDSKASVKKDEKMGPNLKKGQPDRNIAAGLGQNADRTGKPLEKPETSPSPPQPSKVATVDSVVPAVASKEEPKEKKDEFGAPPSGAHAGSSSNAVSTSSGADGVCASVLRAPSPPPRYAFADGIPRADTIVPSKLLTQIQEAGEEVKRTQERIKLLRNELRVISDDDDGDDDSSHGDKESEDWKLETAIDSKKIEKAGEEDKKKLDSHSRGKHGKQKEQKKRDSSTPHRPKSAREFLKSMLLSHPEIIFDPVYAAALRSVNIDVGILDRERERGSGSSSKRRPSPGGGVSGSSSKKRRSSSKGSKTSAASAPSRGKSPTSFSTKKAASAKGLPASDQNHAQPAVPSSIDKQK